MLKSGIVNPHLASLLARVRHTNTLVIADVGFPSWPGIETVDLSLVPGIPTVLQVFQAVLPVWNCGAVWMADEFKSNNPSSIQESFAATLHPLTINFEPHVELKKRVPAATGLIRTGDTTVYSNVVLVSA